ncbi:MAG: glycosyltransferase family 4 protein [Chitinophagaceae bacterium]|nr:glycosyltransferase family 4 protein [Chitinophagaceae bacterium]
MTIYINARFLSQPITGVQRYGIECSRKIKKLHPESVFLAPRDIINTSVAKELNAICVGRNTGHLWEQKDLPAYMKNMGSGPLFNPCNTAPLFYNNNFVTLHDLAFRLHPEWNSRAFSTWYNFMVPRVIRKAKHVFTVSKTVATEISAHYNINNNNISVTYNGLSGIMQPTHPAAKEPIVLAVGSFNLRKNHESLIRAFISSPLRSTHKLYIVGDKNKVFADTGINEQTLLDNNITLLRQLSEQELSDLYNRAEIVASVSAYEGFGIPVLEGAANKCKLLCSDIPVYRELYGEVAHFCRPYDIADIAGSLTELAAAKPPLTTVVNNLLEKYNYERSAATIIDRMTTTG